MKTLNKIFYLISDESISTLRGQSVVLTCPIDVTSCGELHSVKWFKGNDRVAVVSGDGTVENVEGQYSGRWVVFNFVYFGILFVEFFVFNLWHKNIWAENGVEIFKVI